MGYVGPWNSYFLRARVVIELGYDRHGMIVASYSVEEEAFLCIEFTQAPTDLSFKNAGVK